jgi:hypothetical protein
MRALRQGTKGALLIVLLSLTTSLPLHAVEAESLKEVAMVTGDCLHEMVISEGASERLRDRFYGMEGVTRSYEWDSDDPRLTGTAIGVATWIGWYAPEFIAVMSVSWDFQNELGSWTGTATGLGTFGAVSVESAILEGGGAYEGLTAYLVFDWNDPPPGFRGVIFEGEMPAFPSSVSPA